MQPMLSSTVSGEASHPDTKTMGTNSHGRHRTESHLIQMPRAHPREAGAPQCFPSRGPRSRASHWRVRNSGGIQTRWGCEDSSGKQDGKVHGEQVPLGLDSSETDCHSLWKCLDICEGSSHFVQCFLKSPQGTQPTMLPWTIWLCFIESLCHVLYLNRLF